MNLLLFFKIIMIFYELLYIYSSNSLNTKKKSYPSNLLKIPHVFLRSNEVTIYISSKKKLFIFF